MEAKDTAMNYQECQAAKHPVAPPFTDDERIAQAQAEISFKAGRMEEGKKAASPLDVLGALDAGIKAGIREVVEWTENNSDITQHPHWQAKLKEWDLNMDKNEGTERVT